MIIYKVFESSTRNLGEPRDLARHHGESKNDYPNLIEHPCHSAFRLERGWLTIYFRPTYVDRLQLPHVTCRQGQLSEVDLSIYFYPHPVLNRNL